MPIVGCSMPSGGQGAKVGHSPCWRSNDGEGQFRLFMGGGRQQICTKFVEVRGSMTCLFCLSGGENGILWG